MGKIISDEQKAEIVKWLRAGASTRDARGKALSRGWSVSQGTVAALRAEALGGKRKAKAKGSRRPPAPAAPDRDLAARVAELERLIAAPPPPESIDARGAIQRALDRVSAKLASPDTDPRAVADLARTVLQLSERLNDDGDDLAEPFDDEAYQRPRPPPTNDPRVYKSDPDQTYRLIDPGDPALARRLIESLASMAYDHTRGPVGNVWSPLWAERGHALCKALAVDPRPEIRQMAAEVFPKYSLSLT